MGQKLKLKWQIEFVEKVRGWSNRQLLNEALGLAMGDDYDGCFTSRGAWQMQYLERELEKRLGDWLKQ